MHYDLGIILTAFAAFIVAILPAIGTFWVSVSNGKKADAIIIKSEQIHELTNANLSKVTAQLAVAMEKIEGLQKMVTAQAEAKAISDAAALKVADQAASALKTKGVK